MSAIAFDHPLDLTHYFEFVSPQNGERRAMRLAGTRVGVEYVLRDYLNGASPEELALRFPTVSLEQVHALITYYLARKEDMDAYLEEVWRDAEQDEATADTTPSPFSLELRRRLTQARTAKHAGA